MMLPKTTREVEPIKLSLVGSELQRGILLIPYIEYVRVVDHALN